MSRHRSTTPPPAEPTTDDADGVVRPRRCRGDAGEGVISAAIAVLIVAFLGAAMWLGFQRMWQRTEERTNTQIEQIGTP